MSKTVEWYQPGVDKDKGGKLPVGFVTPVQELDESGDEGEDDAEDESESDNDNMEEDEGIQDDDDDGWITPSNFKNKRMEMLGADTNNEDEESEEIIVACLTSDFAMQNVLKQLHLNVLSTDGLLIKEKFLHGDSQLHAPYFPGVSRYLILILPSPVHNLIQSN